MKKILLIMLIVLTGFLFGTVSAEAATSGKCGKNLKWSYSKGTLTISGSGAMYNYEYGDGDYDVDDLAPWNSLPITKVVFSGSNIGIGDGAFSGNTKMNSFTIPENVSSIGDGAFYYCSSLTEITFKNGVKSIDKMAFCHCKNLKKVNFSGSVTTIGGYAFRGCTSLKTINIPSNITNIEAGVFEGCTSLESIVVNSGNKVYDSRNSCNAIIEKKTNTLVSGCKKTVIPYGIKTIKEYAFCGHPISNIKIPYGVMTIGEYAFASCWTLKNIVIPSSVKYIRDGAFHLSGLMEIVIPDSVKSIGGNTFSYCDDLTHIELGTGIKVLEKDAFNCVYADVDVVNDIRYVNNNYRGDLYFRRNYLEKHSNGTWRYYSNGTWLPQYSGFASNSNGRFRITNGVVNFSYTNVIKAHGCETFLGLMP